MSDNQKCIGIKPVLKHIDKKKKKKDNIDNTSDDKELSKLINVEFVIPKFNTAEKIIRTVDNVPKKNNLVAPSTAILPLGPIAVIK